MKRLAITAAVMAITSITGTALAGSVEFTGKACVVDGDTIFVGGERDAEGWCHGPIEARLEGVDAFEWSQTCTRPDGTLWHCGEAGKQFLIDMTDGREVACQANARGYYKRPLARCVVTGAGDTRPDLAAEIVRAGLALATSAHYRAIQDEAEAAKRGVWAGTFVHPSTWRKRNR